MLKINLRYITNSRTIIIYLGFLLKDIADFDINYKLAPLPSMTSTHASKPKKKVVDEQLLARYESQLDKPAQSSGRRRLKKLCEVNESQEMLPSSDPEEEILPDEQEFQKFGVKDDEDLRKQKEAQQQKKQSKKLKGNQQLDKFIQKNADKKQASKNDQKPKPRTQLTLHEINMFKNQKKKQRKYSDDFIVSDQDISEQIDERQIELKRLAAYQAYNGSKQDENLLIQRAKKLSLTASSPIKQDILEEYAFKEADKPKGTTSLLFPEKKPEVQRAVRQDTPVSEQKKEGKSKPKAKPKQQKFGPLAGQIIVFTGEFQGWDKDQIIEVCEQLGADCPKSFTKKTNLLLQGSYVADAFKRKTTTPINETKKSKDAIEKGIRIVTFDQLDEFFKEKTGFYLDHHLNQNKVGMNPVANVLFKPIDESYGHKNAVLLKKEQKMDIQNPKTNLNSTESSIIIPNHVDNRLWTEKYKPKMLEEVIGQNSQIKSLREWLEAWEDIHIHGNKREAKQTKGWSAAGSINSKAALLSGDPGIGKTTTARLLAAQYKFSVTQFNASDVRNKSGVNLLQANSHHIGMSSTLTKPLIIMDEVDGMSSGDRGGIAAIINMIKSSRVPIICICNDRSSQKIRSLAGHCLDVKFHKPMKTTMVKRLKEILILEGGSGEDRALEQLVETFQNDMRQILSYLQIIFKTVTKKITIDSLSRKGNSSKDSSVMINHLDASRKLLNRAEFNRMRIQQRNDCFFVDSDMVPLMVHQNILNSVRKTSSSPAQFRNVVKGLQGFVIGDMLDRSIRKEQEWGLMPSFGFMTCVYAPEKMSESIGFPAFPAWLGKFSSERKMKRLAKEFKDTILPQSKVGGWRASKTTYLPMITKELAEMLKNDSVQQAVMLMETYSITPAIINEHLASLYYSSDKTNPLTDVPSTIKGKLTRLFNKRHEDAKLKNITTKGKLKVQHIKFDPVLEQAQQQMPEQQQQPQKQEEAVKTKGKGKQKKKK